jgi:hypothetical protein
MTDLDQRFRAAAGIDVPDLWPDIEARDPRPEAGWAASGRRLVAFAVAILLIAGGIPLAVWALRERGSAPASQPARCENSFQLASVPQHHTPDDRITAVAPISGSDVWAVGWFGEAGISRGPVSGIDQAQIDHWDGTSWTSVPAAEISTEEESTSGPVHVSGRLGFLQAVDGTTSTDVWAAGSANHPLIEHWDGHAWRESPSPSVGHGQLTGVVAISPTEAWAVGDRSDDGTPLIERWDGHAWRTVTVPSVGPGHWSAVAATGPDDVWAAGFANQPERPLVGHWDGTAWRVERLPTDGAPAVLMGIDAVSATDVWSVGYQLAHQEFAVLIEHWDGAQWTQVNAAVSGLPVLGVLRSVAAVSADDLWMLGYTQQILQVGHSSLVLHWDGRTWSKILTPRAVGVDLGSMSSLPTGEVWLAGATLHGLGGATDVIMRRTCSGR